MSREEFVQCCANIFMWSFQYGLKVVAYMYTTRFISLILMLSNGMIGLFTNLGKTPVWALVVLLGLSVISLSIFVVKLCKLSKATHIHWEYCRFGFICLYYVLHRDGRRVAYVWWPKFVAEIGIHLSYVVCSIAILVLVKRKNHTDETFIGADFNFWVLANTAAAVLLSLLETHISHGRVFLLNNGEMEEIHENLMIPAFGNERIMERVDPPVIVPLNVADQEVEL